MPPSEPPKQPEQPEPANGDAFTKVVTEAKDLLAEGATGSPHTEEIRNRFGVWLFRAIIALIVSTVPPATSFTYGYGTKTAELTAAAKKRSQEVQLRKFQLKLKILDRVMGIAEKAEFRDTTSLYRLGLVARVINENHGSFGIRLVEAEHTMRRMFDRLSPLTGLRKRIAEADILIKQLQERLGAGTKNESRLWEQLRRIRLSLEDKTLTKRRRFALRLEERQKDRELIRERVVAALYSQHLDRERKLRAYFKEQLAAQVAVLDKALKDAEAARKKLRASAGAVSLIIKQIRSSDRAESDRAAAQLQKVSSHVIGRLSEAELTIAKLREVLSHERAETKKARQSLAKCKKNEKLAACDVPVLDPTVRKRPTTESKRRKPAAAPSSGMRRAPRRVGPMAALMRAAMLPPRPTARRVPRGGTLRSPTAVQQRLHGIF